MLNPNIEMLENLISAAVSTRYKEVPPTEEEFLTLAQSMRATLSTLPVMDEEFAEILVRLRASIVIQMDVGVYINDRNTPHKSWLPSRRADLDFFFWNRYMCRSTLMAALVVRIQRRLANHSNLIERPQNFW